MKNLPVLTLVDLLQKRAIAQPDRIAYTFLADGMVEAGSLTYKSLDKKARNIATLLQSLKAEGERALLLYPAGLEFLAAFFGCLYAGVIAIPAPPPEGGRLKRTLPRLRAIAKDAEASLVLTTSNILPLIEPYSSAISTFEKMRWLDTEKIEPEWEYQYQDTTITPDRIAYLQYTSGSTSTPKGVMLSHFNLMHHCRYIQQACDYEADSITITWMPYFHDYGLVEGLIIPLYNGTPCYLMSPFSFIKRPIQWLKNITKYKGTHSQAPNFAYDLCIRRVKAEDLPALDLRSWQVAANGAEPINPKVMEKFVEIFSPAGFRWETFTPAYGLAEYTLMVSNKPQGTKPTILALDGGALEHNKIVEAQSSQTTGVKYIPSCGRRVCDTQIAIVDPESLKRCQDDGVGEVWVSDPSIAQGYWRREEATRETFQAFIADTGEGPFLRTGDLGFLRNGELYIAGRIKDLIIISGTNHYPQDIEWTVQEAHRAVRPEHGVAFSVAIEEKERLVVACEVERHALGKYSFEEIVEAIRKAIGDYHEVDVYAVVLLKQGSLPKTASGKIQRSSCRQCFLTGELEQLTTWTANEVVKNKPPAAPLNLTLLPFNGKPPKASAITNDLVSDPVSQQKADKVIHWLRDYAENRINSRLIDERRCVPPYIIIDFGNQGLMGMQISEKYGGLGLRYKDFARVLEQLAAIDLSLATLVFLNNTNGIRPIQNYAPESVREELLPLLARGRELASFGLTEPVAGANVAGLTSIARSDSQGGWRLQGLKRWNGSAWAGVFNVFVRLVEPNNKLRGITGFVVRQGTPGLRVGPEALTMGVRGIVQNTIYLDNVLVSEANLLGELERGMEIVDDALSIGRLCTGVISLGGMKRCAQIMLRYAKRRTVATGRLLDSPITLNVFSELSLKITVVETLLNLVIGLLDTGQSLSLEVFIAVKVVATEYFWRAVDDLMQLLGGRGYMENNLAPQIFRDARMLRIGEGPNESLLLFFGRSVNHSETVSTFLRDILKAPDIADRLKEITTQIGLRCLAAKTTLSDSSSALSWSYFLSGEVALQALLLATVRQEARQNSTPRLRCALEWLELQFELVVKKVLEGTPTESVLLSSQATEEIVSSYTNAIGDIEQSLAGVEEEVDPLLCRDFSGVTSPNAKEPSTVDGLDQLATRSTKEVSQEASANSDFSLEEKRSLLAKLLQKKLSVSSSNLS